MAKSVKYTVNFLEAKEGDLHRWVAAGRVLTEPPPPQAFGHPRVLGGLDPPLQRLSFAFQDRNPLQVPHAAFGAGPRLGLLVRRSLHRLHVCGRGVLRGAGRGCASHTPPHPPPQHIIFLPPPPQNDGVALDSPH